LVQAGLRTVAYVDVDPRVLTVSLYRSLTVRR
jgi:hypothetical protein